MTNTDQLATFAAAFAAFYAGHHVGDYWIQTDHQAKHKGAAGREGRLACLAHVATYLWTQAIMLALLMIVTGLRVGLLPFAAALLVSGATHYAADRREHGIMFWLARKLPGKVNFLKLGVPREPRVVEAWFDCASCKARGVGGSASDESTGGKCWDCQGSGKLPSALTITDNPSLGTGAWALDQSWHLFWGVFVAALILAA